MHRFGCSTLITQRTILSRQRNHKTISNMAITSIVVLAVLAATVQDLNATPCTDMCSGSCTVANQACQLYGPLGPLCEVNYGVCSNVCDAVCGCVNQCSATCGAALERCRGEGLNILATVPCTLNYANCAALCHAQCGMTTASGVLKQFGGQLTGGLGLQGLGIMPRNL